MQQINGKGRDLVFYWRRVTDSHLWISRVSNFWTWSQEMVYVEFLIFVLDPLVSVHERQDRKLQSWRGSLKAFAEVAKASVMIENQ